MRYKKLAPVILICLLVSFWSSMVYASNVSLVVSLELYAKGVMVGFGEENMGWNETLTRAQAAKIIVTAMGCSDLAKHSVSLHPTFPDVDRPHWAFRFINLACEFGIVKGFPDGTFKPENRVTRAEYLVMLARMYNALGGAGTLDADVLPIEPKWMAKEVSQVPDLVSILEIKEGDSFETNMLRNEAGFLVHGLMEKFGLIYDIIGTLVDVKPNWIVIKPQNSDETVTIPLASDVRCVNAQEEVALDDNIVGEEAFIILDKTRSCSFLRIE